MATRSRRPAARLDGPGDVRRSRFATGGSRVASGGAGTEIELLQRTFQPARTGLAPARGPDDDQLGLITLRVTEGEFYERFLGRALGMNLLATMAVDHGGPDPFDLSFWGAVDVAGRPDPDPASVDNREWLYQLPVTMIELQHHRTAVELAGPSPLIKIRLEVGRVDQLDALAERLGSVGVAVSGGLDGGLRFASVDGHRFSVVPGEA
jgi:hypothetical protein